MSARACVCLGANACFAAPLSTKRTRRRHFVPNLTLGAPIVKSLRAHTKAVLDCHLMVTHPEQWVRVCKKMCKCVVCLRGLFVCLFVVVVVVVAKSDLTNRLTTLRPLAPMCSLFMSKRWPMSTLARSCACVCVALA